MVSAFDLYPRFADASELASRSLTPLTYQRLATALLRSGRRLDEQPLQLTKERFLVAVPKTRPLPGYGLIVFVSPSEAPRLPPGWSAVLDRAGMMFASAENAGNAEGILDRREPLALIAAANVLARYPIDKRRIFVAGFSGGSRIAMRLALAYPDIFRGALLNAGSDPIGDPVTPVPPEELMTTFQRRSRLVYLTGERDEININKDLESRQSMTAWCAFNTTAMTAAQTGHDVPDASTLSRALRALDEPPAPPSSRLQRCLAALHAELKSKLVEVRLRLSKGDRQAMDSLRRIDARFGGLAAPDSLVLALIGDQ